MPRKIKTDCRDWSASMHLLMIFIAFWHLLHIYQAYVKKKQKKPMLISRTKTDGAPAGNNLIKWLLMHEQIVPKKIKYFLFIL